MTFFFPDVSNHNQGWQLPPGTKALIAKATEGQTFTDVAYRDFKNQAEAKNAFFQAYHWLWPGNAEAQARHAFSVVGKNTPLMHDVEELSSPVSVSDIARFTTEYRRLGGIVTLLYLPHWYWQDHMHSPDLSPLRNLGLQLVVSNYRTYDDNHWPAGYGGMTPVQWQYVGSPLDMNAFRGSIDDYKALVLGGTAEMASSDDILAAVNDILRRVTNIDEAYMFGGMVGNGKPALPETVTYTDPSKNKHTAPFALAVELHAVRAKLDGLAGSSGGLSDVDRAAITGLRDAVKALNDRLASP